MIRVDIVRLRFIDRRSSPFAFSSVIFADCHAVRFLGATVQLDCCYGSQ